MSPSEIWAILGIAPAENAEQIREAYLAALPKHHPEDDPGGFMKLREAYEAALVIAAGGAAQGMEVEPEGNGPIRELLADFPRRMQEDEWRRLFEEHCGQELDQQEAFSTELLRELMGGFFLPRRIWLFFDKTFTWSARANHLKEVFPPDYIDYVLNGMRYERAIRDEFFDYVKDAGEDFEAFIGFYHLLAETMRNGELEKAEGLVSGNEGRLFAHPDYRLLVARLKRMQGEREAELDILESLDADWPNDPYIHVAIGDTLIEEKPEEAIEYYRGVLETLPEHYGARLGEARACCGIGLFEDAKASAYELLMQDPFDGAAMDVFRQANEALAPVFREMLEKDQADMEARYKLASCCYNLGEFEEALDLIEDVEPDDAHRAKHYELYADIFIIMNRELTEEDKAILLEYIEAWEGAETDRQRLRFLPEKYQRLGLDDIALDHAEILLTEFPGDPEICRAKAMILKERGDDRGAFAAIAAGLDKNPVHAGLLSIEALLLEETGNPGAAVNSAEAAIGSFPFNYEMWELLARIYERAGDYDEALKTVRRAEGFGVQGETMSVFKAAALYETGDPDGEAQELFEEALEKDPDNGICLEKLGLIYAKAGRDKEAEELFDRFVEKHEGPYAYLLRGWLYANFPKVSDSFSKSRARADFRRAIELNERYAPAWYQLGLLAYSDGDIAEAVTDFRLTLDSDPEFTDAYHSLALVYDECGESENALRVLDEGMEIEKEKNGADLAKLLLVKADTLFKYHMYEAYAELGEGPADAADDSAAAAAIRGRLAYSYYQMNEDEKADEIFRRAIADMQGLPDEEKKPYMGRLYVQFGDFLSFARRNPEAAIEYYRKADESEGSLITAVKYARALRAVRSDREADRIFKRALTRRGGVMAGRRMSACDGYLTGESYYGLGKYKKAREYFDMAIALAANEPDCPKRCCFEALFTLALIALKEGDLPLAREYYKQVLDTSPDREYREAAALFE